MDAAIESALTIGEPIVAAQLASMLAGAQHYFLRLDDVESAAARAIRLADEFDLTIASLDDPSAVIPTDHIWMSDAASWDRPGDDLPQHAGWRNAS